MAQSKAAALIDIALWKVMTSGNCFREIVDNTRPVVLVVGPMGSGKSTNIGIQMGAKYEAREEWSEEEQMMITKYKMLQSDVATPSTSDGFTSKTLNIGLYQARDDYGGFGFLDSAGIDEDRGEEYKVWTRWSLGTAFKVLPKIRCVMLVLDYRSVFASRGKSVRDIAKTLGTVIGTGQSTKHFYHSMIFLFTNAREGIHQVTTQRIEKLAHDQCAEQEARFTERMSKLNAMGVDPSEDEELQDTVAIITLLKTVMEAKGKIHICCPDSDARSRRQQQTVQRMIEASKPITKEALIEIAASRETSNFLVLKTLVKLITEPYEKLGGKSYIELLQLRGNNLEQLLGLLDKQKERLRAIDSNWQTVQRDEVDKLGRQRADLEMRKKDDQTKIRNLQMSTKKVKVDDAEVKKEYPASGWWALCMFGGGWGWGKQSAQKQLTHRGKAFTEYKIRKNNISGGDYTTSDVNVNGQSGSLDIRFTSEAGSNLDLTVDFFAQEKDTQEAKDKVSNLERQVQASAQEIQETDQKITGFRSADSAQALVDLYMSEKDNFERTEEDFVKQLDKLAVSPSEDLKSPPSEWDALCHIFKLIDVLNEKKMLPRDLPGSTRESLDEFRREYTRIEKLLARLKSSPGSKFLDLTPQAAPKLIREASGPVAPSTRARAHETLETFAEVLPKVYDMAMDLFGHIHRNPSAFATALLVYGLLLRMWPIKDWQDALGLHLIAAAMNILIARLLGTGMHGAAMALDGAHRKAQGIAGQAQEWADEVRHDMGGKIDKISELVKDEIDESSGKLVKALKEQFYFKCTIL